MNLLDWSILIHFFDGSFNSLFFLLFLVVPFVGSLFLNLLDPDNCLEELFEHCRFNVFTFKSILSKLDDK